MSPFPRFPFTLSPYPFTYPPSLRRSKFTHTPRRHRARPRRPRRGQDHPHRHHGALRRARGRPRRRHPHAGDPLRRRVAAGAGGKDPRVRARAHRERRGQGGRGDNRPEGEIEHVYVTAYACLMCEAWGVLGCEVRVAPGPLLVLLAGHGLPSGGDESGVRMPALGSVDSSPGTRPGDVGRCVRSTCMGHSMRRAWVLESWRAG